MSADVQGPPESEPPSTTASDEVNTALVDRTLAVAHLTPSARVAVIGRHTLPFLLALMRRGCAAVRSLRPGAPSPDCEASDLAWIVDPHDEGELDEALRAARSRAGLTGRVIVETADYRGRDGVGAIPGHAMAFGFDVVSFDHNARRLVFVAARRPVLVA